jgi:hypothetical protein
VSPNRRISVTFGVVYFLLGLFGAVPAKGLAFAQVDGNPLFGIFGTNPFQNAVEVIIGIGLIIAGASGAHAAKVVNRPVGVILLVIGVSGFFVAGTDYNPFAITLGSAILHTAVGALLLLTGLGADRSAKPAV